MSTIHCDFCWHKVYECTFDCTCCCFSPEPEADELFNQGDIVETPKTDQIIIG